MKYTEKITELSEKGFSIVKQFYSNEEIDMITSIIDNHSKEGESFLKGKNLFAIRQLLNEVPELINLLFNNNLKELLSEFYFLTKAIYWFQN